MKNTEALDMLKKIASGIADTFGSNCEVLIHDFDCPENAIGDIHNGHVTGRKVGDPLTDLALKDLLSNRNPADQVNYSLKTDDGRMLKSTNILCSGKNYNYALCINFDYTNLDLAYSIIGDIIRTRAQQDDKLYKYSWEKIYDEIFESAIQQVGKPVALMNKDDRIAVVKYLFENGAFVFQKGIVICAERLNVSRFTVYNYLKELGVSTVSK
jgi:predicted transcriptional regulator YheO